MGTPWADDEALVSGADYSAVELAQDGQSVYVMDQLALPEREVYVTCRDVGAVAGAIKDMLVRGAPAIGVTAAYGMVLAGHGAVRSTGASYLASMEAAATALLQTRPTAVNLSWAVQRCLRLARAHAESTGDVRFEQLRQLALEIHRDDVASCRAMGGFGGALLPDGAAVLTHCNAGALATGGYGTALGVIRGARDQGKRIRVFATETRPYLQGARLTAWELVRDGFDVTVIADNMVGHCMASGRIDAVVVGADRIARNGDVANKIGTFQVACLARRHGLPMHVAAPWSTVDMATPTGETIPIEERAERELTHVGSTRLVASGASVYNPAFDVTPASLVTAIITETGVFSPEDIAAAAPCQQVPDEE